MKRFYKIVSVRHEPGGWAIMLDGKPVKTPARKSLLAPTESLAGLMMQEWAGQGELIVPDSMPLTQIISTKLDRVLDERAAMTVNLLKYIDTDLLCYRIAEPPVLAERQAAAWDPWLQWFEKNYAAGLQTTTGLSALKQPSAVHAAINNYVDNIDDDRFTVLQMVAPPAGSIILAMAFVNGALDADELFNVIRVDERYKAELYNEEKYGVDPAQGKKDAALKKDLEAAQDFLAALPALS